LFDDIAFRRATVLAPILLTVLFFSLFVNVLQREDCVFIRSSGLSFWKVKSQERAEEDLLQEWNRRAAQKIYSDVSLIGYPVEIHSSVSEPGLDGLPATVRPGPSNQLSSVHPRSLPAHRCRIGNHCCQKYRWMKKSKIMMKQGVQEELKETEREPASKICIRKVWRETARKRMIAVVPGADVILAGPTPPVMPLPCSIKWNQWKLRKLSPKVSGFWRSRFLRCQKGAALPS